MFLDGKKKNEMKKKMLEDISFGLISCCCCCCLLMIVIYEFDVTSKVVLEDKFDDITATTKFRMIHSTCFSVQFYFFFHAMFLST